jgi:hypothetical protein
MQASFFKNVELSHFNCLSIPRVQLRTMVEKMHLALITPYNVHNVYVTSRTRNQR